MGFTVTFGHTRVIYGILTHPLLLPLCTLASPHTVAVLCAFLLGAFFCPSLLPYGLSLSHLVPVLLSKHKTTEQWYKIRHRHGGTCFNPSTQKADVCESKARLVHMSSR